MALGLKTISIYATIWSLRFPRYGDHYVSCEWIEGTAQGVPAHVGTPTPGFGYEDGDPYAEFLPPPLEVTADGGVQLILSDGRIVDSRKR